ncbi:MAG: alpha-galactosidase [Eubacteriales bacterium]|nr:alpha-galactosidase [Eubacteriales bacterium]
MEILKEYCFSDMAVRYQMDEKRCVGLLLHPKGMALPEYLEKRAALDSMVQLKIAGDMYNGAYAPGNTMRNGESVRRLSLSGQKLVKEGQVTRVQTFLEDGRGREVCHVLEYREGEKVLRIHCEFTNRSKEVVRLEMLESCSMDQISPYLPGDGGGNVLVHRLQSRWSQEGRLLTQSMEDLQLEPSWSREAVRCERFGQAGSLPVNHYFPFLALEDQENHVFWGMQLAHNASWQMEIYRTDDNIAISAGLADREFGHWLKEVAPGETFGTPEAIVSVWAGESIDEFTGRLTSAGQRAADAGPKSEQELPIIFNEYCTTWGCPSHENICAILEKIRNRGFSYFVIDCGWFKEDGVPWDISMGDYQVSSSLFPQGLEKTIQEIRKAGLVPGIWFEIENVGKASRAYQMEEHLLKLDGHTLTTTRRRFWDMNDPWVQEYLEDRVIGTLKKYGFGYMKMDYNDTVGMGCDGCESIGEGLRRNMEAARRFVERVKEEVPGIILENCASGGHRLEPGYMALTSMASFSDAHECPEIPIIAADLHRAILPRQSQIWAVIRREDSLKRIAYSVGAAFLGRMCISGDVQDLEEDQWQVIDEGIAFYKEIAPIIKYGQSHRFGPAVPQVRHPEGWQALVRIGEDREAYVVLHTFHGKVPETIRFSLPERTPDQIKKIFHGKGKVLSLEAGILEISGMETDDCLAVHLG